MFGTQETKKGFILDRQRRSTVQTWQLTCGKKDFWCGFLDLSEREAKLLSCWLVCFDGMKSRKLNYRADACGFDNTEDLNKVKQHIWCKGETWSSVTYIL